MSTPTTTFVACFVGLKEGKITYLSENKHDPTHPEAPNVYGSTPYLERAHRFETKSEAYEEAARHQEFYGSYRWFTHLRQVAIEVEVRQLEPGDHFIWHRVVYRVLNKNTEFFNPSWRAMQSDDRVVVMALFDGHEVMPAWRVRRLREPSFFLPDTVVKPVDLDLEGVDYGDS